MVHMVQNIMKKGHKKGPILELKIFELVSVIQMISSEMIGSDPMLLSDLNFKVHVLELVDL